MTQINQKELEKFNNSLEKAMEVLARNWKKVAGDSTETILDVAIIRDKEDDSDLDSINCHKWYVHVHGTARATGEDRGTIVDKTFTIVDKTFYMDLED